MPSKRPSYNGPQPTGSSYNSYNCGTSSSYAAKKAGVPPPRSYNYNNYPTHPTNQGGAHIRPHFGSGNQIPEAACQEGMLKKMVKCNTLTVCSSKPPEYYLKLIRLHFIKIGQKMSSPAALTPADRTLSIQALGLSSQNLVYVACLVTMKGYATYKKIKNDHLSVPIADSTTGRHMGLVKKVRLTVKLLRAENFDEIVDKENENSKLAEERFNSRRAGQNPDSTASEQTISTGKLESSQVSSLSSCLEGKELEAPHPQSARSVTEIPQTITGTVSLGAELSSSLHTPSAGSISEYEAGSDKSSDAAQREMQRFLMYSQQDDDDLEQLLRQGMDGISGSLEDPNFQISQSQLLLMGEDGEDDDDGDYYAEDARQQEEEGQQEAMELVGDDVQQMITMLGGAKIEHSASSNIPQYTSVSHK